MAYSESTNLANPTRVTGLFRVLFDDPREVVWCGSIRFAKMGVAASVSPEAIGSRVFKNGVPIYVRPPIQAANSHGGFDPTQAPFVDSMPDGLFYIKEDAAGDNEIVVDATGILTKADTDTHYQPYRYRDANNDLKNFYGIIANGYDNIIKVGRGVRADDLTVKPIFGHFIPNNAGIASIGADPSVVDAVTNDGSTDPVSTFAIRGVRRICLYNGSIVYAGYKSWNPAGMHAGTDTDVQNFDHWLVFSDTIGSDYSCYSVDTSSALAVGDTPGEPITAVVVNSVATDHMGIKGQLLAFTPQKIVFYDGLPPLPDDDRDSNFHSVAPPSPVGCWAGRTVVRTDRGVMFLGTDGVVYLIPFSGAPIPVSRALEPHFRRLTSLQQQMACAEFLRGYYILSIPHPGSKGAGSLINKEVWVADMRRISNSFDYGVRWVGPWHLPGVSVMCVGRGAGDDLQLMAGSAESGQIFEFMREDVNTDAPTRSTLKWGASSVNTKQRQILPKAHSNIWDDGNIHQDKAFEDITAKFEADNPVDLEIVVTALGASADNGEISESSEKFTDTVSPSHGQLGSDTLVMYPLGGFEPMTFPTVERLRGRGFTITITEKPNASIDKDPKVAVSDISIGYRRINRRK